MRFIFSLLILITATTGLIYQPANNAVADTQIGNSEIPLELTAALFDEISAGKVPIIRESVDKYIMDELPYYHLIADKNVESGIIYESENQQLSFTPVNMVYDDGSVFKASPYEVNAVKHWDGIDFGQLVEGRPGENAVGIYYPNAFGIGNNIGVLTHKYKLKEVESIATKPIIPKTAKTLDIWFEIVGDLPIDWDYKTDIEIAMPVQLGDNSYLQPAQVWDSFLEDVNGLEKENRITIPSYFRVRDGRYYYVKSIPVGWLETAQYPIYTDADITWGSADEFYGGDVYWPRVCRVKGSNTKFAVSYTQLKALQLIIGEYDGGTGIDWGATSGSGMSLFAYYGHDLCSPADDIVVLAYTDGSAGLNVRAAEISGRTVNSWGSEVQVYSSGFYYSVGITVCDDNEFMAFGRNTGNNYLYGMHGTLSGTPKTTITNDDHRALTSSTFQNPRATEIGTDKAYVCGRNATTHTGVAVVVSWDGAMLSAGSVVAWASGDGYDKLVFDVDSPYLDFGETDNALCTYELYTTHELNVIPFTISGTTPVEGTSASLFTGAGPSMAGTAFVSATEFVSLYVDDNDSDKLKSRYSSVNWSTRVITRGSAEEVDSNDCARASIAYLQSGVVAGVYHRDSDTSGQARIGKFTGTTPTVSTVSITSASTITAIGNGLVSSINGGSPIERGFCYTPCASGTPDYSDSREYESWSSGTGSYSLTIDGLTCGTCYNVRAYAATTSGTGYGDILSFATVPGSGCYTTDRLYLQFEPDQISSGTISDQSGEGNDVYYTLEEPSSITVTLSSLLPTTETTAQTGDDEDEILDIWSTPGTPNNMYESGSGSKFGIIGEAVDNDISPSTGLTSGIIWSIGGVVIVLGVGIALAIATGSPLIIAFGQGVVMLVLWIAGILTGWMALTYPFAVSGIVAAKGRFY